MFRRGSTGRDAKSVRERPRGTFRDPYSMKQGAASPDPEQTMCCHMKLRELATSNATFLELSVS